VPQLGPVEAPVWAVVGRRGKLIAPLYRVDEDGALTALADTLATLAQKRRILALRNEGESALSDKVKIGLRRGPSSPGEAWSDAEPGPDGVIAFEEGDRLAIAVQNDAAGPLYVGILDVDLNGLVHLHGELLGSNEAFAPGKRFSVGEQQGGMLVKPLPPGHPFDPAGGDEGAVETIMVIATTSEIDFGLLAAGRTGETGTPSSIDGGLRPPQCPPIAGALLRAALSGQRDGEGVIQPFGSKEDWTAKAVSFVIRRKGG
jgi:hypothetical protein